MKNNSLVEEQFVKREAHRILNLLLSIKDALGNKRIHATNLKASCTITSELQFELNRVHLRFRDSGVEGMFLGDTLRQSTLFIRVYLIAGTLLYIAFGLLDSVVGGQALFSMFVIRYGIVSPILLGIFVLTFYPMFFRVAQFALGIAMLSSGLGVVAMTAIMGAPYNRLYYVGIIMVVSY